MKYVMKQKILALGDDFAIFDESGAERFYVDGRAFSLGQKLSFQNAARKEVAFIRQKLLSLGSSYEVLQNDQVIAKVKKHHFTLFRCRFSVDVPGPDDLEAQGNFLDHEYEFSQGSTVVAQVTKKWIAWSDSYAIDIAPNQNEILILACAVVIDLVCHDQKND